MNKKPTQNFTDVRRLTNSRFLNLYEMDALTSKGDKFNYYFCSRRFDEKIRLHTHNDDPEGIIVYAICEDDPEKILLINEYRFPIDGYIYEMPAGLIEDGETPSQAAVREIREETGMEFTPYGGDELKPYILVPGFSDEAGSTVFGTVKGAFSKDMLEDSEYIDAFIVDKNEASRILHEETVSARTQLLLLLFLNSNPDNPFGFLEV